MGIKSLTTAALMVCLLSGAAFAGTADIQLVYQGAFIADTDMAYAGGHGLAYDPTGDNNNGSFHVYGSGSGSWNGEFTKAALIITNDINALNVATTIQATSGGSAVAASYGFGPDGLEYLPAFGTQNTPKVYGTKTQSFTLGYIETDGTDGTGGNSPWGTTGIDGRITGKGLSEIPADWVTGHLPDASYTLIAAAGNAFSTRGPAIMALQPTKASGDPLDVAATAAEVTLLEYSSTNNLSAREAVAGSAWHSVAWVKPSDGYEALLIGGLADVTDDDAVEPMLLFYDPADLADVADGNIAKDIPVPVKGFDLSSYFFSTGAAYGLDFDWDNNLLYVMESGTTSRPVVHVFNVIVPEPATMILMAGGALGLLMRRRRKA